MHRPIGNRCLVKKDDPTKKIGRLHVPEQVAREEQASLTYGTVVATGEGVRDANGQLMPMAVSPGDRILFGKYQAVPVDPKVMDGDDSYIVMQEENVMLILDPDLEEVR